MSERVVPEIRVERAWVGAPAGPLLANPNVWLLAGVLLTMGAASLAYVGGHLGAVATVLVDTVAIYVVFTVLHESIHGIAHPEKRTNDLLGRIAGLLLMVSWPLFRAVHLEHHSHTNDAERDPDLVVARQPRWAVPLWCLAIDLSYRRHYFGRRLWRSRADLAEAVGMEALLLGVFVAAYATGWLGTVLVVWILPGVLALVTLAFLFDFLPHYPYDSRTRYFDTRIYPGRLLNVLLLGQNYHLIHHLWTTIPWFRYQRVFAEIEAPLRERGARIGWTVPPLPAVARETVAS